VELIPDTYRDNASSQLASARGWFGVPIRTKNRPTSSRPATLCAQHTQPPIARSNHPSQRCLTKPAWSCSMDATKTATGISAHLPITRSCFLVLDEIDKTGWEPGVNFPHFSFVPIIIFAHTADTPCFRCGPSAPMSRYIGRYCSRRGGRNSIMFSLRWRNCSSACSSSHSATAQLKGPSTTSPITEMRPLLSSSR